MSRRAKPLVAAGGLVDVAGESREVHMHTDTAVDSWDVPRQHAYSSRPRSPGCRG
jgi:hypothetical protein